jgi:hypothetical protein
MRKETMPNPTPAAGARHNLPPLILHPFSDPSGSVDILESARDAARMIFEGGPEESRAEQLRDRLLRGRYAEVRMLFFVGKDVFRWLGQCLDFASRSDSLKGRGLVEQSFAEFLIRQTPAEVAAKLRRWGVTDYARIFARAIGIHAQFQEPPAREILAPEYLRTYYRFADYSYLCWKEAVEFPVLSPDEFFFALYASGEYSKLLEQEWNGERP